MTVREWFRVQRGALWASNEQLAVACWTIATAIEDDQPIRSVFYIGDFAGVVICATEEDDARSRRMHALRQQIERDQRRMFYTKDLV